MTEFKAAAPGETEAMFRQFLSYLFAQSSTGLAATGVLSGLVVAQTTTASSSIVVGKGAAIVQTSLTAGASPLVGNDDKPIDVLTPSPVGALPRNDLVIFNADTGAREVVIGTPNASPTDPNVTAAHVKLARLRHAANATTIPAAKIDNLIVPTVLASAGMQVVANSTQRDALPKYVGLKVYRTSVKREETWDGTGWFTFAYGEETVTTNSAGDFSISTGLSSILTSTVENANGGSGTGNRQNITVAKNAAYSGGNLSARIYAADTKTPVASATAGIKWNAWGYA